MQLRLSAAQPNQLDHPFADFDAIFAATLAEADEFYDSIVPPALACSAAIQTGGDLCTNRSRNMVYFRSGVLWGTSLLIWSIFCATFDGFLRPVLIRRGANLLLLLIFAGVLGGLIAFGVIGLFIWPVVLAVAYTLFVDWVEEPEVTPQDRLGDAARDVITPRDSAD